MSQCSACGCDLPGVETLCRQRFDRQYAGRVHPEKSETFRTTLTKSNVLRFLSFLGIYLLSGGYAFSFDFRDYPQMIGISVLLAFSLAMYSVWRTELSDRRIARATARRFGEVRLGEQYNVPSPTSKPFRERLTRNSILSFLVVFGLGFYCSELTGATSSTTKISTARCVRAHPRYLPCR